MIAKRRKARNGINRAALVKTPPPIFLVPALVQDAKSGWPTGIGESSGGTSPRQIPGLSKPGRVTTVQLMGFGNCRLNGAE